MTAICPCCDKPINLVQDMEPAAGLPDVVFALSTQERKRRCGEIHSEICLMDWDKETLTGRAFVRCLVPFPVHERPERTFNWGVWAEVSPPDLLSIIDDWKTNEELSFDAKLANKVAGYAAGAPCRLVLTGPKTRPMLYFSDGVLGEMQRLGVPFAQTFEWTKPFHGMIGN